MDTIRVTAGSTALIVERGQHSKGSGNGKFGGPDRYVAVQIVPEGVQPLDALRSDVAQKRGIQIINCGEGYRNHTGPRSALGQALAEAERIVDEHDTKQRRILAARRAAATRAAKQAVAADVTVWESEGGAL